MLAALDERELIDRRDGAVWLRGEKVGLDKDRVLVKSSGEPAYRLPDIAYHQNKLGRGYDLIVDVLGADHIAEHQEVAAALRGMGFDTSRIRPVIYQFGTLTRHGEQVKMSTRRAEYVTLDELRDEVGSDAARFFFLSRKSDSHLEFDLDLAKQRSTENPVFYVQYAHARIASVFRQAAEAGALPGDCRDRRRGAELRGFEADPAAGRLRRGGDAAARELEPHRVVFYSGSRAALPVYNHHRVLGDGAGARPAARLALLEAVRRVLVSGLDCSVRRRRGCRHGPRVAAASSSAGWHLGMFVFTAGSVVIFFLGIYVGKGRGRAAWRAGRRRASTVNQGEGSAGRARASSRAAPRGSRRRSTAATANVNSPCARRRIRQWPTLVPQVAATPCGCRRGGVRPPRAPRGSTPAADALAKAGCRTRPPR